MTTLSWFPFRVQLGILLNLSRSATCVFFFLASRYTLEGMSTYSNAEISSTLKVTERSVLRGLAELEKAGVGKRGHQGAGNNIWLWFNLLGRTKASKANPTEVDGQGIEGPLGDKTNFGNPMEDD